MNSEVVSIFILAIFLLAIRSFLVVSADFRQRLYHKLQPEDVEDITQRQQKCKFTIGGTALNFQDATMTLSKNTIEVVLASGEVKKIKIRDIQQVQSPHPGKLLIFPDNAAAMDIGKRWFIYMGEKPAALLSGTMPFFWQPSWLLYAGELRAADKKSVAFYLKLMELVRPT